MEKFTLGFSPCPNDTFIFDALVNKRLDSGGAEFQVHLADVEELNRLASRAVLDITKISIGAIAEFSKDYQILDAGSALGSGCGPLLISKTVTGNDPNVIESLTVAIPGRRTTANLLLSIAYPGLTNKSEMIFSDIEDSVLSGRTDAGLIIHENRFTYQSKGLKKIVDLGEYWEDRTGMPLPLGCIAIRRSLPEEVKLRISDLIRQSIRQAFSEPEVPMPYVSKHSQEMSEDVMKQHIALYVNEFSVSLGETGRAAIRLLLDTAFASGVAGKYTEPLFAGIKGI